MLVVDPPKDRKEVLPDAVRQRRWAVILAGGDGTRLQELTQFISGDERPKQFCPIIGGETLLTQTGRRAASSVPLERTLLALTRRQDKFYAQEPFSLQRQRVVQPRNRGTAPPILFCLHSIAGIEPNAIVAVLPSDHHYADDSKFTQSLEAAFAAASDNPESVILLGAHPNRIELEYGWIELGPPISIGKADTRRVRGFWEKPSADVAGWLIKRDSVWNTFVMVGHVEAFLNLTARTVPRLHSLMSGARLWSEAETHISDSVYASLQHIDFSRQVLSQATFGLLVQYARDLGWSDLGDPDRVLAAVHRSGAEAPWAKSWIERKSIVESLRDCYPQAAVV